MDILWHERKYIMMRFSSSSNSSEKLSNSIYGGTDLFLKKDIKEQSLFTEDKHENKNTKFMRKLLMNLNRKLLAKWQI